MTDPKSPAEWREAVDAAHGLVAVDAARKYGLVTGGPTIDVDRCEEILARGAAAGYRPRDEAVEETLRALAGTPFPPESAVSLDDGNIFRRETRCRYCAAIDRETWTPGPGGQWTYLVIDGAHTCTWAAGRAQRRARDVGAVDWSPRRGRP